MMLNWLLAHLRHVEVALTVTVSAAGASAAERYVTLNLEYTRLRDTEGSVLAGSCRSRRNCLTITKITIHIIVEKQ